MSDIVDLGRRISVAFDTIAAELERLPTPDTGEAEALRTELEAERRARQEAEARAAAAQEEAARRCEALQQQLADATANADRPDGDDTAKLVEALDEQGALLERLTGENDRLQAALAAAQEERSREPEADQINQALVAEIQALKSARETDRAEMDEILAALKPLLAEVDHA